MWYFEQAGLRVGPVPEAEIRAAIAAGRVSASTLVWRAGFQDWRPAGQTELGGAFPDRTPPPLPPPYPVARGSVPSFGPSGASRSPMAHYAGFWIRAVAVVIDSIIVQIVSYGLGYLVTSAMAQIALASDRPMELSLVDVVEIGATIAWVVAYYVGFQSGAWQGTPGKRIVGIHVIRTDGRRIGPLFAVARTLAQVLSGLPFGIGYMMAGWTDQKKALHDIICGTRVVYGKA